jgi:hypothetical protein
MRFSVFPGRANVLVSRFLYHHAFEQRGVQAQGQQATVDIKAGAGSAAARARRLCGRHAQLQVHLALQHRPRVYLRLGFVPTGEMEDDEVSARLNVIPGTRT